MSGVLGLLKAERKYKWYACSVIFPPSLTLFHLPCSQKQCLYFPQKVQTLQCVWPDAASRSRGGLLLCMHHLLFFSVLVHTPEEMSKQDGIHTHTHWRAHTYWRVHVHKHTLTHAHVHTHWRVTWQITFMVNFRLASCWAANGERPRWRCCTQGPSAAPQHLPGLACSCLFHSVRLERQPADWSLIDVNMALVSATPVPCFS